MVRSVANDPPTPRSSQNTPMPWDRQQPQPQHQEEHVSPRNSQIHDRRDSHDVSKRDSRDSQRLRIERLGFGQQQQQQHKRKGSGNDSSAEYTPAEQNSTGRRHDYDVHAMETSLKSPQIRHARQSIPAPVVTVRSEFPTLSRSRQQQSLACLVTIEVPEAKWRLDLDDLRNAPPVPPLPSEDPIDPMQSHRKQPAESPFESQEVLEEITQDLRTRVDNWHGLEFQR
jgi:hypothetical protein